jgi:hypothetical protein
MLSNEFDGAEKNAKIDVRDHVQSVALAVTVHCYFNLK